MPKITHFKTQIHWDGVKILSAIFDDGTEVPAHEVTPEMWAEFGLKISEKPSVNQLEGYNEFYCDMTKRYLSELEKS